MKVNGKHYRTVWMEGPELVMIDQNQLPFRFEIIRLKDHRSSCEAICDMRVRGAGAIGATAAYTMAQAFLEAGSDATYIEEARTRIEATRPTARNLFYATERVFAAGLRGGKSAAMAEAQAIADEDTNACYQIGLFGAELIRDGMNIETHCNAGWLAFTDYGSALAPMYQAHSEGKNIFVYVDETRPRSQGARLTAWELKNEEVPHSIIPDNAGAWLMSQGRIDLMITGADRIAANGDTANKIGTLEKAIAAHYYGIPFYIAAPLSTFDFQCPDGSAIPIENRNQDEVLYQSGPDRQDHMHEIRVASPGSGAINPSFDVTPAALIHGIITEKGIIKACRSDIESLKTL
jgi:S-methyl-5-thioribose-1-phosphate isomerase